MFVDVLGTLVEPLEGGHFPTIEDARFYDGVLDGLSEWVNILADEALRSVELFGEHIVSPMAG